MRAIESAVVLGRTPKVWSSHKTWMTCTATTTSWARKIESKLLEFCSRFARLQSDQSGFHRWKPDWSDCSRANREQNSRSLDSIFLAQLVVVAVQVIHVLCDDHTFGVLPRTTADSIARIDSGLTADGARAQISAPCLVPRLHRGGKPLANCVGPGETAQVRAVSGTRACDEEAHIRRTL